MAEQRTEEDRLQVEVAVQRLAEVQGVPLAAQGDVLVGGCPFHGGEGLSIVPVTNRWSCGHCDLSGGPVEWVMKAQGVSRRHAVELLADGSALLPVASRGGRRKSKDGPVSTSTVRRLPSPVDAEGDDHQVLAQVVAYYHQTLKQSPEAMEYLAGRGLQSPDIIDRFKLGYSNRTLGYRLPMKNRQAGAEIRSRLQKLGVLRETGHEHFRGSVVIPVFDAQGRVVQMYGRKITPGLRPGTANHSFLSGAHRGVWNRDGLTPGNTVILCQSLIDALTFWCNGYTNVTATYGFEGFTDDHLTVFQALGTKKLVLAFRRTDAGDKAAQALAARLTPMGIESFRIQFPAGQDVNEFALSVRDPAKALGELARNAVWLGSGTTAPRLDVAQTTPPPVMAQASAPRDQTVPDRAADPAPKRTVRRVAVPEVKAEPAPASAPVRHEQAPQAITTPPTDPEPESIEPAATKPPDFPVEVSEDEVVLPLGDARYRVRGLGRNTAFDVLKVNLLCARDGAEPVAGFHVDTLDIYAARQRAAYIKQAAQELGVAEEVVRHDLGRVLFKLEELQEQSIRAALEPKEKTVTLSPEENESALALLRDPRLLDRVLQDFRRCGVVGEEANLLMGYLASISRKLDDPLAVVVQSSSAAGKTNLMEAVLAFVPDEDRVKYSAMTGQSLFYMGETNLQHKVLAIAEEEGAERAAYALKLLQSEGEITIASTGKDPGTGRLVSQEYRVVGPVQIFLTTTAIDIDEELMNRCVVLTVDEDREQTRAIHRLQRERQTLEGLLSRQERQAILTLHKNAQRLLRPLAVVNPYARYLTFLDDRTRTRRDHTKYLGLIRAVALLHQHQRPVKTATWGDRTFEFIEVQSQDIATANRLCHHILGHSLGDLAPQTRRLLLLLDRSINAECETKALVRADFRFTRRDVRAWSGWTDFQVRTHLDRLVALEYVLVHRGARGRTFEYELLYDGTGQDGQPFVMGLIDVTKLPAVPPTYSYGPNIESRAGDIEPEGAEFEPSTSPHRAAIEPGSSPASSDENASKTAETDATAGDAREHAHPGDISAALRSYTQDQPGDDATRPE